MVAALVAAGIASLVLLHPARESSVPSAWVERYATRFWIAVLPRLAQHGVTEPCNALTALLSGGSACLGRGVRHDLSQRGVGQIVTQQQGVDQREAVEVRVDAARETEVCQDRAGLDDVEGTTLPTGVKSTRLSTWRSKRISSAIASTGP